MVLFFKINGFIRINDYDRRVFVGYLGILEVGWRLNNEYVV